MSDDDILQQIPDEDLPKLKEVYEKQLPSCTHVYNYIDSVIRWRKVRPDVTVYAPHGDWRKGTLVGVHKVHCHELFVSTLEEDQTALSEAIITTKRIEWNRKLLIFAVPERCIKNVIKALEKTTFPYHRAVPCDVWVLSPEKASKLEINCPPEVYIDKLTASHAVQINSVWPHRYDNSHKYIAKLIEMNGGYGVFLKSDGTLVAWILRNLLGVAVLQTEENHKRKGYASLVTKVLAKEMGMEGLAPIGTVLQNNIASGTMMSKLGFETFEAAVFVESKPFNECLQNGVH